MRRNDFDRIKDGDGLNTKFHCFMDYPWAAKQTEIRKLKREFQHLGVRVITDTEDWDKIASYPETVIVVSKTIKIINKFRLNKNFDHLRDDDHVYFFFCKGKIKGKIENRLNVDISNWTEFVNNHSVEKKLFTPDKPPPPRKKRATTISDPPGEESNWDRLCAFFNTALSNVVGVLKNKTVKITIFIGLGGIIIYWVCLRTKIFTEKDDVKNFVINFAASLAAAGVVSGVISIFSRIRESKSADRMEKFK